MDELELLKKHWKSDAVEEKQMTSKDIYPMLWKKSSSIVKTLFYISIAELIFWILVNTLPLLSSSYRADIETSHLNGGLMVVFTLFSFVVIFLFIYLLYQSHKSISVTDNAKKLMENIIKTRNIIKYYVAYNLIMVFITMSIGSYYTIQFDPNFGNLASAMHGNGKIIIAITLLIATIILAGVIWLFYKLLYGILLKRLNRNYNELKKLEV